MKKIFLFFSLLLILSFSGFGQNGNDAGKYSANPASWPGWASVPVAPMATQKVVPDNWGMGPGRVESVSQYTTVVLFDTVSVFGQNTFNAYKKTGPNSIEAVTVEFWNSPRRLNPGRIGIRIEAINSVPRYFIE